MGRALDWLVGWDLVVPNFLSFSFFLTKFFSLLESSSWILAKWGLGLAGRFWGLV